MKEKIKYKVYYNLFLPRGGGGGDSYYPDLGEYFSSIKGRESQEFHNAFDLIAFIAKKVEDIDFNDIINDYLSYYPPEERGWNKNQNYFTINIGDDWNYGVYAYQDLVFVLYDLEEDPAEKNSVWLYLDLKVIECEKKYHILITPSLDSPSGQLTESVSEFSSLLDRYFYNHPLIKEIKKTGEHRHLS